MAGPGSHEDALAVQAEIDEALAIGDQVRLQLQAVEEQRGILQGVVEDYTRGREALEALKSGAAAEEVLVPLGGGNFVHARIPDASHVLTNLGSGLHVENNVDRALERLAERLESAKKASDRLGEESRRLSGEIAAINARLQQLAGARMGGR